MLIIFSINVILQISVYIWSTYSGIYTQISLNMMGFIKVIQDIDSIN